MEGALLAFAGRWAAITRVRRLRCHSLRQPPPLHGRADRRARGPRDPCEGRTGAGAAHVPGASTCTSLARPGGRAGQARTARAGACRARRRRRTRIDADSLDGSADVPRPRRPHRSAAGRGDRGGGGMPCGRHPGEDDHRRSRGDGRCHRRADRTRESDRVLTGADLDRLDDAQLRSRRHPSMSLPAPAPSTSCAWSRRCRQMACQWR